MRSGNARKQSARVKMAGWYLAGISVLAILNGGCAGELDMPEVKDLPQTQNAIDMKDDAVITLTVEADKLLQIGQNMGDPIPMHEVGPVVVSDESALNVINLLAAPYNIAVMPSEELKKKRLTIMDPKVRPLGEEIEMIAAQAGLFYTYRKGVLKLESERHFTLRLPNLPEVMLGMSSNDPAAKGGQDTKKATLESFSKMFESLGAKNLQTHPFTGLISFTADFPSADRISKYLRTFEEGREALIYNAWLYEVQLTNKNKAGIHWNELTKKIGVSEFSLKSPGEAVFTDGLTLGITGNPGKWVVDAMVDFLKTQGNTKAVSKPTLTLMNGGVADFSVGDKRKYIEKVEMTKNDTGDPVANNVSASDLETGLKLQINANHSNGVIYTRLDLSLEDLIEFTTFEAGEVKLSLPHTKQRRIFTEMQSRPGDLITIGGLIQDRGTTGGEDFLGLPVPVSRSAEKSRTELVILMRPRLVKFKVVYREEETPKATGADIIVDDGKHKIDVIEPSKSLPNKTGPVPAAPGGSADVATPSEAATNLPNDHMNDILGNVPGPAAVRSVIDRPAEEGSNKPSSQVPVRDKDIDETTVDVAPAVSPESVRDAMKVTPPPMAEVPNAVPNENIEQAAPFDLDDEAPADVPTAEKLSNDNGGMNAGPAEHPAPVGSASPAPMPVIGDMKDNVEPVIKTVPATTATPSPMPVIEDVKSDVSTDGSAVAPSPAPTDEADEVEDAVVFPSGFQPGHK